MHTEYRLINFGCILLHMHLNKKKLFAALALLLLLIAIPLLLFVIRQQQDLRQRADTTKPAGNTDTCGLIQINVSESPICPAVATVSGGTFVPKTPAQSNNVVSYTTTYTLRNTDTQTHNVKYQKQSYYCTTPYGVPGKDLVSQEEYPYCIDNPKIDEITVAIEPGQTITVPVTVSSPTNSACGAFQTDFNILAVDGNNSCIYEGESPNGENGGGGASGFCMTGVSCSATPTASPSASLSPTATPTPTRTITPTASPSATLTPTASPSASLTLTLTPTVSATPSATPTGTLTPTLTLTPTATLTATLTPTASAAATPTIIAIVPSPTLAATGSNEITALIGIGGLLLMFVGTLVFFML